MKIDGRIIHYEISKQLPNPTQSGIEETGGKPPLDEQKVEEKNQPTQDTIVNLSTASKEAQTVRDVIPSEPNVRENKISELKQEIESGNYHIDHAAVADKIVNSFIDEIS